MKIMIAAREVLWEAGSKHGPSCIGAPCARPKLMYAHSVVIPVQNMSHVGFTSGEELLRVRNRDQTLLPSSEKVDEAMGSWMEEKMVESRLQEHRTLLEEPKIARKDQLPTGEWLPESQMVKLTRPGKFWHHMGVETDIGKCLYPEEAVYLIDTGELEVVYDGLPLSLQQAQSVLLQDAHHLDQYLVYSHLTRTGCKVVRHQPHLIFTKYEKDIRLDQHQASRKGTKLKLGSNKASHTDDSSQSASQCKPVDAALEELYACLGDAAVNPLTLEKNGAGSSVSTVTNSSKDKEKESWKKASHSSQEILSPHEIKRRELIEMFPTMAGSEIMCVDVEHVDLLPSNSIPSKKSYRISIEALEYYSIYETRHHYHYENQSHKNWNRKESWNHSRDARWDSYGRHSNWQSRDDSYHSYGYRERERDRDNRWQHSRSQRDSYAWREDRSGWRDSANDSSWRHYNDPDCDTRFRDRFGDSEHDRWSRDSMESRDRYSGPDYDMGFSDRHSDSPQPQDRDQIDYSMWPEWKRKRRPRSRQQGRDSYPSFMVKLRTRVTSWKEYKNAVAEMDAKKQLARGSTRVLWEGRTTPLLTPAAISSSASSSITSFSSTLLSCNLNAAITDVEAFRNVIPQEAQMKVLYDVYLPTATYKKSNPPSPNKRIVIMRDGSMPTPGQILELTSRFVDGVVMVCAVVTDGEVRLYTFSPITLPPPLQSAS
uniref:tRNA-splicing endonuclease subunit Sen54 N-terminal domain-containing protein n=1 Tax=Scylla olivacea TaxID=85551 RepID=A0A0P4VXE2_SCYOL